MLENKGKNLCRRQRERENSEDEPDQPAQLPQSSDGLQLTRVDADGDPEADAHAQPEAQTEEEARQQILERLPGVDWKARIGTAGTPMEQQRVSPIVELSMLLVSFTALACNCFPSMHCLHHLVTAWHMRLAAGRQFNKLLMLTSASVLQASALVMPIDPHKLAFDGQTTILICFLLVTATNTVPIPATVSSKQHLLAAAEC